MKNNLGTAINNQFFQVPESRTFIRTGQSMDSTEWLDLKRDMARGYSMKQMIHKYQRAPQELERFIRSISNSEMDMWRDNPSRAGQTETIWT